MRDRLTEMEEAHDGQDESMSSSDSFSNVDLDDVQPQAVEFSSESSSLDNVLQEAQDVRKEIQLIRLDVNRLKEQNSRMFSEVTHMSVIRQDSNAIAAAIKSRGEAMLAQLHRMEVKVHELEASQGSNAAVARIARTQYMSLSNSFRDVMFEYNEAEMGHRENCKANLQRQMEIVGQEVTGEQIEEMIENNKWNVFTQNMVPEGKTASAAYSQIESRHKEIMDLENRLRSLHELFLDVAMLVEEQGPMMNTIEANINKTDAALGDVMTRLDTAKRHDRNNPFKKMFCGCFPCYK